MRWILSILWTASAVYAQPGRIDSTLFPSLKQHAVEEYAFDLPVDPQRWEREKPGMHVSFAITDRAYFRAEVPEIKNESTSWLASGWRGERLNAMILVWSPDTLNQVRFKLNDLKDQNGNILDKKYLRLSLVRYVLSNFPYDARNVDCGVGPVDKGFLMPDRLVPMDVGMDRFDLPGRTTRPVWLALDIPPLTKPGSYSGVVQAISDNAVMDLNIRIKVENELLPKPNDWTFRLDLWQNPWVIADYYHVKPWSQAHELLLKDHLKLYADVGGKYITTYAVHSPWGDNEYYLEEGMIDWVRRSNGSWKFDYRIFDQYVELAMKMGIDEAITIYTPLPWGERFRYMDERTGAYVYERWLPLSDTFKTNWNIFLTDLKSHLEKKGWFNKTYLGVNENTMEQTLSAIKVIRDHSSQWRITYAGDWHGEANPLVSQLQKAGSKEPSALNSLLDDYSSVFNKEPSVAETKRRTADKKTSSFYICCTPPKPNTFVFSPPVEGRWLGWYTMAHGYDGLLRWAYDSWTADPTRDTRHVVWPAGDCYMVYPGGQSSIRLEKVREGIVDFEKIRILKREAMHSTNPTVKKLMEELESHLQTFNNEKEFIAASLEEALRKGKELVDKISDLLK